MGDSISDRVRVWQGKHRGKHGKVIKRDVGWFQKKCEVKLDRSNDLATIKESDLDYEEKLGLDQINANIQNFTDYISNASELLQIMRRELPNHLGMLREALNSGNKSEALKECNSIESHLKKLCEAVEDKRIILEKIVWAVKN